MADTVYGRELTFPTIERLDFVESLAQRLVDIVLSQANGDGS